VGSEHAELEIVLRWSRDDDTFDVGLAYDDPYDPLDRRDYVDAPMRIDTFELLDLVTDTDEYGRRLGAMLLTDSKVSSFYDRALTAAEVRDIPLHLRLLVDPRAPLRYHQIRWESLRDSTGTRVATRHNLLFSRYMSTPDWRPVQLPAWHRLKALVVVASPAGLDQPRPGWPGSLDSVNVDVELTRVRSALADMDVIELAGDGAATVNRIIAALDEGVDLFYLVCHGGMVGGEPHLCLEDDDGGLRVVEGSVLTERIAELRRPPTVAVLCSCQSAGAGDVAMASDDLALTSLGPRMSGAGVSAVVAMQGSITMATAEVFFAEFFRQLRRLRMIDRAMAVARGAVSDRPRDWWMPVLFTRLRLGRAWYEPGSGRSDETFRALVSSIAAGRCTPVLGSGVAGERILPSREELAKNFVDQWLMPMAAQNRDDLAKVAQYLSVRTAPRQTQIEVCLYLANYFRDHYGDRLPAELRQSENVSEIVRTVGEQERRRNPDADPYAILASLRLPVYVTTSWTGLLEDAIREAGRTPIVRHFDWHRPRYVDEEPTEPTRENPLVYHLFGTLEDPSSLVVTEDHYFEWLTAWIKRVDKDPSIPGCVARALTDSSLLFLGYRLDDWEFRVLFRSIKSFNGAALLHENLHVGVQLNPQSSMIEPEAAEEYLGKYFGKESVTLYYEFCHRFLVDLAQRQRQVAHV
jgi:hypothetical protein